MLYPLKKLALLAFTCLLLGTGVSAQTAPTPQPEVLQSNKNGNLALVNRGQNSLPARPSAPTLAVAGTRVETEPLLLLLFGLVVFIGATTLKYKRPVTETEPQADAK